MTVYLIPGWKVSDPEESIGVLRPHLEAAGFSVDLRGYGFLLWPWSTSRKTDLASQALLNDMDAGDMVIAHSNGAVLSNRLSWLPRCPDHVAIWLNPALDRQAEPGPALQAVHVFYSPRDWPVKLARFIPGSRWGDMGARGPEPFSGWDEDLRFQSTEWSGGHSAYREHPDQVVEAALDMVAANRQESSS